MSVNTQYQIYRNKELGTLSEADYNSHLDELRTEIGRLIDSDPNNHRSDIGKRIFDHLSDDLPSAIAFSQVSRGVHERSRNSWFVTRGRDIVLKYIQQNVTYVNYLRKDGWQEVAFWGATTAGLGLTIASGVKASIHASRIPADAPRKTVKTRDEYGDEYEYEVIDHPEAKKSDWWTVAAVGAGTATAITAFAGIEAMLKKISLVHFFSALEKELMEDTVQTNFAQKMLTPGFRNWKLEKMRQNLVQTQIIGNITLN